MREETSRVPLEVVPPPEPEAPGWAPRASTATTPKPTAAAPTEASFTMCALRRAGARREEEGAEVMPPSKRGALRLTCECRCGGINGCAGDEVWCADGRRRQRA